MSHCARGPRSARLACEPLEDRLTPAVAYALSGTTLLSFDTAVPATALSTPITGVDASDALVGIDFRPQNGQLYALGVNAGADTATLYAVSVRTGVATAVGGVGAITGAGDLQAPSPTLGYGIDFNPTVDRLRVVTGNLNFRVNPNTGTLVQADTNISGETGTDSVTVDATAYTNNAPNVNVTTQYTLDQTNNSLNIQGVVGGGPNGGVQSQQAVVTLGGMTLGFTAINGFDIPTGVNVTAANTAATGLGLAVLQVGTQSALYSIDLTSGVAVNLGAIGTGLAVQGFAVQSDAPGFPAVALNDTGTAIVRFSTAAPGTTTTAALPAPGTAGGVAVGDVLVGLDYRPNTGQLFALAVNAVNNTLQLYRVSPQEGGPGGTAAAVTPVGGPITNAAPFAGAPTFPVTGYGFDFNPTAANGAGLIRVVTDTGLNFRINPDTGAVAGVDTNIGGNGSTGVTATAYTNSFGQPAGGATTQYTLDSTLNQLFIQNPPNGGTQSAPVTVTVGGTTLDFTAVNGFDIPAGVQVGASSAVATGFGYAVLTVGTTASLYRIDLATGAATNLGAVGGGSGLSLGDASGGVVNFASAALTADEGGSASVVLNRTSGSGPLTVQVAVTGGSASAGTDFAAGPFTITFPDGSTTATLNLPFTADALTEGTESLTLTIASAAGGARGATASTTITVNDTSTTPVPAPFYSGATVVGGNLVLTGAGVAGGTQVVPLPPGSVVFFTDLNGDGRGDVVIITPALGVVVDGQTGRFLALATDVTGDGVRDLLIFNANGTTTTTDGRTGITVTA